MDKSILIVEDDKDLAMITSDMLTSYGYQVTWAKDGDSAFTLLTQHTYSLLLLDINLPKETGFDLCKEIRKVSSVPIIFASARTSEDDKVIGLDIGGDDYLAKPYSLKELLSRINSLIRRTYSFGEENQSLMVGEIEIHPDLRVVKKREKVISLSLKEFDLLLYMARNKNKVIKKETLLSEVWGAFSMVEDSTVSVHIRWLREKLEDDPKNPVRIKTVWGIGYCLVDGDSV